MRTAQPRVVVVGDSLLDVDREGTVTRLCPDAPVPVVDLQRTRRRPGGAALGAVLAARAGACPTLLTALGDDGPGRTVARLLAEEGVEVLDVGLRADTPQKERIWAAGQVAVRLDRGRPTGPADLGPLPPGAAEAVSRADAVLVSDYGRGMGRSEPVRRLLAEIATSTPVVWDPHPRGGDPVRGTWLATPNQAEALAIVAAVAGPSNRVIGQLSLAARDLVARWSLRSIAITRSHDGALFVAGDGPPLVLPVDRVAGDSCGAGDAFAVAATLALASGGVLSEAVELAVNEASAFVRAGGARSVEAQGRSATVSDPCPSASSPSGAVEVVEAVRRAGGTVVATGGCFDIFHAGHARLLEQARSLGDCLVVCLNSDRSVRRLKGHGRPIVPLSDRVAVLSALSSVDAVITFDDDGPGRVLEQLQPDIFVKGGDYAGEALVEERVLERWGGRAVVVPYLQGRSTSSLVADFRPPPTYDQGAPSDG